MSRTSRINWEEVDRLVNQGLNYRQIADTVHVSSAAISKHYNRRGQYIHQHFTETEDKTILDCVGKNSLNITAALEEAVSLLPNRTFRSVHKRWYCGLSLKQECLTYLTESFGIIVANRKVNSRNKGLKVIPQTPSKREQNIINKNFMLYNFVTRTCNREFNVTSTDELTY